MSKTRCVKKKMPQLDKLIFVDQVINGLVLFIIVYYMNIYMILPTLFVYSVPYYNALGLHIYGCFSRGGSLFPVVHAKFRIHSTDIW